jgi:hypothetical protein
LTTFLNILFQKELDHVEVSSMDAVLCGNRFVGERHWMRDHGNPEDKFRLDLGQPTGGARFVPLEGDTRP